MRVCLLGVLLALVSGRASTIEAQCDYDYDQVFSSYRTFAWIADDPLIEPKGQRLEVSPLNRKRIVAAIEGADAARREAGGGADSEGRSEDPLCVSAP